MNQLFRKAAKSVAEWTGSAWAFTLALVSVITWAVTGPMFHYSENWQLVINTGSSIVTFLMVFLIQNQQNRDSQMIHLKLGELIRVSKNARNDLINLDEKTDEELALIYADLCAERAKRHERIAR